MQPKLSKKKRNQNCPLETDGFHINIKIWLTGNRAYLQVVNMSLNKSLSHHATKADNQVREATN